MNKKMILPVVALLALAGSTSFSLLNRPSYVPTRGYSASSLPTTIDLNDSTTEEIRNYYSSLNSLSQNDRTSSNLLIHLKNILKKDQKYYSYDSGNAVWQIYEIADRDWEKSPASSTTYGTYDPVANKITGYKYGSTSDGKNNPYVHALYFNRSVDNQVRAWGSHQQTDAWGINREHVWPKAQGFNAEGSGGARGDPFHLMAGAGYANNVHSDYLYGYVDKAKSYTNCGTKFANQANNLLGTSKTIGGGTSVFEPQDSDKGDIARAIFYMVARYNFVSGEDTDSIDQNNPNLELVQEASKAVSAYTSSKTVTGKMGVLTDLLDWNRIDPVDEFEIHRNNLLYKNYTNNRNPFIDFPEWADIIWGSEQGNKYANPLLDRINGSGLSVSTGSINIEPEKTTTISASTSDDSNITWEVVDDTIISLSKTTTTSGEAITVTALKEGETKILVKAHVDGEDIQFEVKVVVAKKQFVFGLSPTYIIIIGVVVGVLVIGFLIFYFSRSSKAKRRINKKVKKTVKDSIAEYNKANAPKKKKKK